jgi:hypothetical protein
MKKVVYLGIILSVLMFFACGKTSVEDVAKDYVKKQCAFDNDFRIDTSKLKYTVTKKEGNQATVRVSGSINFDGQLFLVKSGKKWKISKKENMYETPKKVALNTEPKNVASNAEPKKEVSHTEQTTSHKQTTHN